MSKKNEKIKKVKTEKKSSNKKSDKNNLWVKFRVFCSGIKDETSKIHWTSKNDVVKYSIATIVFIIFCAGFFYLIDVVFALLQSLIK